MGRHGISGESPAVAESAKKNPDIQVNFAVMLEGSQLFSPKAWEAMMNALFVGE